MRLINVQTSQLEEFLDYKTPPYAILSHTWGDDAEELTFRDVEMGRIDKPGIGSVKFRGSCQQAAKDGFGYVWIDTCCIDKTNLVELSEAINSMFRWYHRASICYAYLSDVPSGDHPREPTSKFRTSRWFGRGWTLQELLAPKQLRFYHAGWGLLGNKAAMRAIVGKITGIPHQVLLGITELHSMSVAQRMSWAARRETKRKEDLAYCLLGIFGVTMPMIYGEGGDQAFLRLQEQIMKTTRDDSILAWGLCPEETPIDDADQVDLVGRILATSPSDFANSGHIICRNQPSTSFGSIDISGGSLRLYTSLFISASRTVALLDCGPEHTPQQVVGIPLSQTMSGLSDEYVRPGYCYAILQSIAASSTSPRLIHIRNDGQRKSAKANEQYWLYDEDAFAGVDLDLVDVNPPSHWDQERAIIVSTITASDTRQQILTRFRHREEECPDFVVLLELSTTEPQCHVMTCSRDTLLQELDEKLQHVVQKAYGKRSASNGLIHLRVALEPDQQQSMFTIKPEELPSPPAVTIDITAELQKSGLLSELVKIWEAKEQNSTERLELEREAKDKSNRLEQVKREREMVENKLEKLEKLRRVLAEEESSGAEEMRLLGERQVAVEEQQGQAFKRWAHAWKRWDELYHTGCDEVGYGLEGTDGGTLLHWAAENGYVDVVQLLVEKGTDVDVKDGSNRTALWYANKEGHKVIVQLLLDATIKWQLRQTLEGHSSSVLSVAFSPDSKILASGSDDNTVRLWDVTTGRLRQTLEGHSEYVWSVAFSPDSKILASGSDDKTVRLWDVTTGRLRQTLEGHSSSVLSVAFSPDSKILASGSDDNTVRLWDVAMER